MSAPDHTVLQQAVRWLDQGKKVALATVIETWGSAPQPVGSQLVIDSAGNFVGSVSGGCVEGEVVSQAQDVIAAALPKILSYGVADETAWKVGLACGGRIRIYVEPMSPPNRDVM
jgi:xanthine/CO dehydrogenase XdhC/CoxF family maturation factor